MRCLVIFILFLLFPSFVLSKENIKKVRVIDYLSNREIERKITIEKVTEDEEKIRYQIIRVGGPREGFAAYHLNMEEVERREAKSLLEVFEWKEKKVEDLNVTIKYPADYKHDERINKSEITFEFYDGHVITLLGGRIVEDILGKKNNVEYDYQKNNQK